MIKKWKNNLINQSKLIRLKIKLKQRIKELEKEHKQLKIKIEDYDKRLSNLENQLTNAKKVCLILSKNKKL